MALRILLCSILISMIYITSIKSLPLADDYFIENDFNLPDSSSSNVIHPYKFISLICQQQEQYPLKITGKLCSNYLQLDKIKDQQQRGKRVGWTISV